MSCLAIPAAAAEANSYQIGFDGSVDYLSTGEKGTVKVNIGADRPSGNYTWWANITGGTVTPGSGSGSADSLTLTVTAPTTTGDLTLTVTLSNGTASSSARHTIHVVKPVVISAEVKNSGDATLVNVPVQFKADGKVLNTTAFTIPANSTKTLTYNWTASGLSNGEHTVEIVLDPDNKFNVSFVDGGTKTFSSKFHVGDAGWGLINLLLTIVFVILLLVLFFTYMNKGRKKRT